MRLTRFNQRLSPENLDLTNISVVIPHSFHVLEDAVKGYAGKEKQARELLLEYHHKYRNWHFVVQETQRYAIGNLLLYRNSPLNGHVIYLALEHSSPCPKGIRAVRNPKPGRRSPPFILAEANGGNARRTCKTCPRRNLRQPISKSIFQTDTSCHQGILRCFFQATLRAARGSL